MGWHMISENPARDYLVGELPRRRGRPRASWRPRVGDGDYYRLTADPEALEQLLSAPLANLVNPFGGLELSLTFPGGATLTVKLQIATTRQRLGVRYWFRCPSCGRRVRDLYTANVSAVLACRKCLGLVYESQYSRLTPMERFLVRFLREGSRMFEPKRRRRRRRRSPASPEEGQRGNGSTETPMQESGTTSLDHYRAACGRFLRDLE